MRPFILLPLAFAACAHAPLPAAAERISYASGACYGTCPVYTVTLDTATGEGKFTGAKYTTATGPRAFHASPAAVQAFRRALAEARDLPAGAFKQGGARCATFATDMPTVKLSWNNGASAPRSASIYLGCDMRENRALFERIRRAPDALPIAAFIGERRSFQR